MRPLAQGDEAFRLLVTYVHGLAANPITEPALQRAVAAHLRELVDAVLEGGHDREYVGESVGMRAARLHAIKADIIARLGDPSLSVAAVAARQSISPRYVHALFQQDGISFSHFVLHQRLARAHRMLANPHVIERRITDVATDAGFGDLSYFNRTFRRPYGVTPSDVRALALYNKPGSDRGRPTRAAPAQIE